jgi:hypothetical protein
VRIPTTKVGKSDFQPDSRFDELRDLQQRIAERRARILRSVLWFVLSWVRLFQVVHSFKRLFAHTGEWIIRRLGVERLETSLQAG